MIETPKEVMKTFVGSIGALIVAFLLGTLGMIYSTHTTNEVFKSQLNHIQKQVAELKQDLKEMNEKADLRFADRWTKTDHVRYSIQVREELSKIRDRLRKLESQQHKRSMK